MKKRFRPGESERVWWEAADKVAAKWGCTLISHRGAPWPSSKRREFVYGVEGRKDDVKGYFLGRPG
jgi:hypothetical protein